MPRDMRKEIQQYVDKYASRKPLNMLTWIGFIASFAYRCGEFTFMRNITWWKSCIKFNGIAIRNCANNDLLMTLGKIRGEYKDLLKQQTESVLYHSSFFFKQFVRQTPSHIRTNSLDAQPTPGHAVQHFADSMPVCNGLTILSAVFASRCLWEPTP